MQRQLLDPAVKGTINVLTAAKKLGVRRVVVTSSVSAITPSPNWPADKIKNEDCWTDEEYCKQKGVWHSYYASFFLVNIDWFIDNLQYWYAHINIRTTEYIVQILWLQLQFYQSQTCYFISEMNVSVWPKGSYVTLWAEILENLSKSVMHGSLSLEHHVKLVYRFGFVNEISTM